MTLNVQATPLEGVLIIQPPIFRDARGFFLESYHRRKYAELGIPDEFVQDNHSRSSLGVVRGLHYQDMTAPMGKLVRCTFGAVFDVAVDLRVGSPTFARWFGVELNTDNVKQLWVPAGFAHGFATLTEFAEVQYKCTNLYAPASEGAVIWNDPDIGIEWPVRDPIVSAKDGQAKSLKEYQEQPAFRHPLT